MKVLSEYLENVQDACDKIGNVWEDENGALFQKLFREQIRVLEEVIMKKTDVNG